MQRLKMERKTDDAVKNDTGYLYINLIHNIRAYLWDKSHKPILKTIPLLFHISIITRYTRFIMSVH